MENLWVTLQKPNAVENPWATLMGCMIGESVNVSILNCSLTCCWQPNSCSQNNHCMNHTHTHTIFKKKKKETEVFSWLKKKKKHTLEAYTEKKKKQNKLLNKGGIISANGQSWLYNCIVSCSVNLK